MDTGGYPDQIILSALLKHKQKVNWPRILNISGGVSYFWGIKTSQKVFKSSSLVDIILLHRQRQWLSEWWGMLIFSCHVDVNRPTYLTYNIFLAISLSVLRSGLCVISHMTDSTKNRTLTNGRTDRRTGGRTNKRYQVHYLPASWLIISHDVNWSVIWCEWVCPSALCGRSSCQVVIPISAML